MAGWDDLLERREGSEVYSVSLILFAEDQESLSTKKEGIDRSATLMMMVAVAVMMADAV